MQESEREREGYKKRKGEWREGGRVRKEMKQNKIEGCKEENDRESKD